MSHQNILLLSRLIETGLPGEKGNSEDEIIATFSKESLDELKAIQEEISKKSKLIEFYEN